MSWYLVAMGICFVFEYGATLGFLNRDPEFSKYQDPAMRRCLVAFVVAFLMCWSTVFGLLATILGSEYCKGWTFTGKGRG